MIKSKIYTKPLLAILDYGHGGSDTGASGNGVIEKNANRITGKGCKAFLESKGAKVLELRKADETISLEERTRIANGIYNKYKKDYTIIYISIHHNAGGGDRGEFIHSIVMGDSLKIAEAIGKAMNKKLGQQKKIYSKKGSNNRDYYHVLRETLMAAVIVEVAFLDNTKDVQICDTPEEQKRNGEVIANGILDWYGYVEEKKEKQYYIQSDDLNRFADKNGKIKLNDFMELTGNKYIKTYKNSKILKFQSGIMSSGEADKLIKRLKKYRCKKHLYKK